MAARDIIFATVIIFAFSIGLFSFHFMFNVSADKLINNTVVNESAETVAVFQNAKQLSNRMDNVVFGLTIAISLGIIITGWFVGANPIFMFIYLIFSVIATVLATMFHWAWEQISLASVFGGVSAFPLTNFILTHIEIYVPAIAFLGLIAMFAKPFLTNGE